MPLPRNRPKATSGPAMPLGNSPAVAAALEQCRDVLQTLLTEAAAVDRIAAKNACDRAAAALADLEGWGLVRVSANEVLVALERGEDYEDVHPDLVAEDAIGDRWPAYRVLTLAVARRAGCPAPSQVIGNG